MNITKIHLILFGSFFLLLFSLTLSFTNISKNSDMLKNLEKDQIKLSSYVNQLNYNVKSNQTTILQARLRGDTFSENEHKNSFSLITKNIIKLDNFVKQHPKLSENFKKRLLIIKKRVKAYELVQKSLLEAIKVNDIEDIDDAFLGYNDITIKFSKDTAMLIEDSNLQLYNNILILEENNTYSSRVLLFSFFIAILLITYSLGKLNLLNRRLNKQLLRAQDAEENLQFAQTQLLKYNDDLEAEITKKTNELHEKIYTNFLSGLPNRNKLLEDATQYTFTKIAILNIDKFQSFNDVYGEEIGNIALSMSADFLKEAIKNTQLSLYHISGDEFVLVCQSSNNSESYFIEKVEKILINFKSEKFSYEDKSFQFMMSAGIAYGKRKKLLAYADMALKDAKKRNVQLAVYDEEEKLEQVHKDDIACYTKLKQAIDDKQIVSFFQPITPIQDDTLPIKYESLVRLSHNGIIISPFRFIDVAKANRVYHKVTKAVIHNTLSVIKQYNIPCSLNLSLADIDNERTMTHFFDIVQNFENNEMLTVELLETEDFNNYDAVYDFCVKVRSFGIKVALDDFGSGYSNFSHILNLPVDYIKIDASLISNIDRDLNSRLMVETIVDLAHKLHVLTIAEFVSSQDILDVIKELGVDYAQGFHLGKPEPIEKHLNRLKKK